MRIPVEIDDEIIVLIDEIAKQTGLTREQIVENNLRKIVAEDQKRIKQQRLRERNLESEK